MKNIFQKILTFFSLCIVSFGCKEDFINLANPSALTEASYYKTAVDLKGGLTAAYSSLQPVYNYMYQFAEIPSDNSLGPIDGQNEHLLDKFEVPTNHTGVSRMWTNLFRSVAKTNLVIARAEPIVMDATQKARYVAEAKFIRALDYFNLVRIFGDVPIVTAPVKNPDDALAFKRDAAALVYAQIIKDLTESEGILLPKYTGTDVGRATNIAAKILLSEVYMTQKNFPAAVTKLKETIDLADANGLALSPKYDDIFDPTKGNNTEVIFSIQYQKNRIPIEGSLFSTWFIPQETGNLVVKAGRGYGYNLVHPDLDAAFEANDNRKAISVDKYVSANGLVTLRYTKKYLDPTLLADQDGDNDWTVYRYADLVLLYAEALNETGSSSDALTQMNRIRKRAGLANKTITDQATLRFAIEQERRIELNMEGHRWFDLLRTGRAIEVMNNHFLTYKTLKSTNVQAQIVPTNLLSPIPETERTVNPNIAQNPGY
jgi:starch-binding outer membrane protein, SusD/RagB family